MKLPNYIVTYEEEKIAALWTICAILCFAYGFAVWAWLFAAKAAIDSAEALYAAARQAKEKENEA